MASQQNLFIGIRGYVLAIDRATGEITWTGPCGGTPARRACPHG